MQCKPTIARLKIMKDGFVGAITAARRYKNGTLKDKTVKDEMWMTPVLSRVFLSKAGIKTTKDDSAFACFLLCSYIIYSCKIVLKPILYCESREGVTKNTGSSTCRRKQLQSDTEFYDNLHNTFN